MPGAANRASFPLIVTVAVPSPFDSAIIGPPRAEVTDFPLSGFVHTMWKSDTVVTARPFEYTDCLKVPCEWTMMGNAKESGELPTWQVVVFLGGVYMCSCL